MPRARSTKIYPGTAAIPQDTGSGCFSGFTIVPLTVILVGMVLGSMALQTNPAEWEALPDSNPAGLSPIFRREVLHWADSILKWASASNLDPNLVATIMQIESCGDPRATSGAGAMGLFQVMPFHFHNGENPYDPEINALRGLNYLARSLAAANGDVRLALAGYNGGIGVIPRAEWTWHAETKRYVYYGLPIYVDAVNNINPSPALDDWYSHYGVSLCSQAAQGLGLP